MSVTSLLRSAMRVGNRHVATHLVHQRALSGADAINALRPFYFAVHPDFFGQHPREREVNENSLKRLNGYLENLQKPGTRSVQPTKLTFYVREIKGKEGIQKDIFPPGFRSVSFTLQTKDVLTTVMDVLKSCSLSTEHMKGLKASSESPKSQQPVAGHGNPFYRPIKWDKSYYSFTGFRDPEQELEQAKKVEPTLSLWLRNHEKEATKKQNASVPRREELKRLKKELCQKFALEDIRWHRSWGVTHRCCQLQSLSRLSQQNPEAVLNLRGHTIIFTDQSGMNASGHVMLGTMDVHHQWTKLFVSLPSYRSLLQQTEWLKERISHVLGGIQVINIERLGPVQPIEEHCSILNTFHKRLLSRRLALHPRSLQGLAMTLENDRSSPSLHEMGHFVIPATCEPSRLQTFLQSMAWEARQRIKHRNQLQAEEEEVLLHCLEGLALRNLSKEPSVRHNQMIPCCRRLLEERSPLMEGLRVEVSHFYSVLQDGDLCIPWDWKG
ncbi:T-cell activation inhibitor, mitochondrial-like isoform X2 [Salvelinus fontinalis]|uniref:T-cell activation inhibitor, mitochondrial-like isoform X2 n=1 Tax=Salvelinus fontinalis TaxID=8038 RepID=UPI0024859CC4|nr:T-cell activation inhibitor, mitochondrial-like isoform X2 [Salvelinus fontinalis]XP_055769344.1 T-cell activation inhibitor, mitochondrial-like isoform X2 [Salvelinus fontinalis]XP_055771768.1 T-cell activation inhibitor, mitochondrial-like isoform X2 [Salvelinus fontinalis]